jgi:hypothetical protein
MFLLLWRILMPMSSGLLREAPHLFASVNARKVIAFRVSSK